MREESHVAHSVTEFDDIGKWFVDMMMYTVLEDDT